MPIIGPGGGSGGAGAISVITSSTLASTAANFDITGIAGSFTHLRLYWFLRGDTAATNTQPRVTLNNDSAGNYDIQLVDGNNVTASASATAATGAMVMQPVTAATATASSFGGNVLDFLFYSQTNGFKLVSTRGNEFLTLGTVASYETDRASYLWRNTAAINRITITPSVGNWAPGCAVSLYGIS
jgi:hypothetical protein